MEQMLINAAGTLAFGGGGIAIVAFIYWKMSEAMMNNHRSDIERVCLSFERALDRFDSTLDEIKTAIRERN